MQQPEAGGKEGKVPETGHSGEQMPNGRARQKRQGSRERGNRRIGDSSRGNEKKYTKNMG